ncbi:MAG: flagellin [Oscillospiraceae bacterium]|nr:flagellin [Oscillospiraceae bacterium]
MRINNNVAAMNAHRSYGLNNSAATKSMAKLSSGYRINSAADDAAGLAISEKMRSQIRGLTMASKNTQDGISLIQTAEGGMQEIDNMIQRVRELVVYAANDTQTGTGEVTGGSETAGATDRKKIQAEIDQLVSEINGMKDRVAFNNKKVISGTFSTTGLTFQVGANANQTVSLTIGSLDSLTLGIGAAATGETTMSIGTLTSLEDATAAQISAALSTIDSALLTVTTERSKLGAMQNRLEYTQNSLDISAENITAAESRIRDVDMAKEMTTFTKNNILFQASTAMLAQANAFPQGVLQLLG